MQSQPYSEDNYPDLEELIYEALKTNYQENDALRTLCDLVMSLVDGFEEKTRLLIPRFYPDEK